MANEMKRLPQVGERWLTRDGEMVLLEHNTRRSHNEAYPLYAVTMEGFELTYSSSGNVYDEDMSPHDLVEILPDNYWFAWNGKGVVPKGKVRIQTRDQARDEAMWNGHTCSGSFRWAHLNVSHDIIAYSYEPTLEPKVESAFWINLYSTGSVIRYDTKRGADAFSDMRIACKKVVVTEGEYDE